MAHAKQNQEEPEKKKRGANGDFNIFERGNGYCGRISLGFATDGTRIRKTVSGKTKTEVRQKIHQVRDAHSKGLNVREEATTVKKLMEDWLELVAKPSVRPRTYEHYALLTHAHIIPVLGRYKVLELNVRTVQEFLNNKCKLGLSVETVRHIRSVFRNALNQAIRWDIVGKNVAALAIPPKKEEKPPYDFSEEQARDLRVAFAAHRHGTLYNTLLGVGLRLGEGLGLRWQDVFLDDERGPRIRIQLQLQQIEGKYRHTTPKTDASRRTIHIPHGLANLLREHRRHQKEVMKPLAGDRWSDEWGLVFTNIYGGPLDEARVRQHFKKLLATHNLKQIRLHDLRHMCATLLLARGVHPKIVQEMLGHENFALTMNVYSHITLRDMKSAADALDEALGYAD